ncbi:hypothetical protein [Kitasatospora sp. LaBMicrA B282]|uniref:hypothetical protein n=1 Tax=Kitasatospora sp. LaBMicrA B282 TaxID=3420949 RepID=UPI003D129B32
MAVELDGVDTDPFTRGVLVRLAESGRPGGAVARPDFLPELPDRVLLDLLSCYHRQGGPAGVPVAAFDAA